MRVELQPEAQHQGELDLFGPAEPTPEKPRADPARLMGAVDLLNRRFGRGTVNVASAAHQTRNGDHSGKQERRSPRYTTRLEDIVAVRA